MRPLLWPLFPDCNHNTVPGYLTDNISEVVKSVLHNFWMKRGGTSGPEQGKKGTYINHFLHKSEIITWLRRVSPGGVNYTPSIMALTWQNRHTWSIWRTPWQMHIIVNSLWKYSDLVICEMLYSLWCTIEFLKLNYLMICCVLNQFDNNYILLIQGKIE